jgi:hypothetical protein
MGYFSAMAVFVPLLAFAALVAPTTDGAVRSGATTASRFSGAAATVRISARIVRDAARIGERFGAPAANMVARRTTLAAADGTAVPALVYDFQ